MTESHVSPPSPQHAVEQLKPVVGKKKMTSIRWLRRHQGILTFIGAVIVFGTFVTKDALRDHLKDLVDSIERSEGIYVVRSDIHGLETHLQKMERDMIALRTPEGPHPELGRSLEREGNVIMLLQEIDRNQSIALANCAVLAENFPKGLREEIGGMIQALAKQQRELRDRVNPNVIILGPEAGRDHTKTLDKYHLDAVLLDLSIGELVSRELVMANSIRDKTQNRYTFASWASYFLYTLGWGLGLAGRLVGAGDVGGED
jgi:hypothetical protein